MYRDSKYGGPGMTPLPIEEMAGQFAEVKRLHQIAMSAIPVFREALTAFANGTGSYLYAKLAEMFPRTKFYVQYDMHGGCMVPEWDASMNIYDIDGLMLYQDDKWYRQRWDKREFFTDEDNERTGYGPVALEPVDAPVDMEKLNAFLREFSAQSGVPIDVYKRDFEEGQTILEKENDR